MAVTITATANTPKRAARNRNSTAKNSEQAQSSTGNPVGLANWFPNTSSGRIRT